jgi:hypothetical protein
MQLFKDCVEFKSEMSALSEVKNTTISQYNCTCTKFKMCKCNRLCQNYKCESASLCTVYRVLEVKRDWLSRDALVTECSFLFRDSVTFPATVFSFGQSCSNPDSRSFQF